MGATWEWTVVDHERRLWPRQVPARPEGTDTAGRLGDRSEGEL
ncbi:hypothetical protein ACQP1W_22315 [Spirillospora sp. CA-255316]